MSLNFKLSMVDRKLTIVSILLSITILFSDCSKDSLYDFFIGPQPNFIGDHKFVPGLNIFGIIRPDSIKSIPMTFVHVEKVIPAISDELDTFAVDNAHVVLYKIENDSTEDSLVLTYINPQGTFPLPDYRPDKFSPKSGERYRIVCTAKDLPVLTAETVVPNVPQLEGDSLIEAGSNVQFSILNDSSAAMYDIYLIVNGNTFTQRVVREQAGNTYVEIEFAGDINSAAQLIIYAYDQNLSKYFAAANLSFKPNTYRPPFTNVQNGYGCFGSLNLLVKNLK